MRLHTLFAFLALLLLAACTQAPGNKPQAQPGFGLGGQGDVPSGFEDALVANVSSPTALASTPDGRLLIATQPGKLRVYQNGALRSTLALDLGSKLCSNNARGLLGMAVDPSFASNGYLYLFYTYNKSSSCPTNGSSASPVHRVSRFTMSGNTVSPSSERVLVTIPSPFGGHSAGDLHIGKDGLLYISVGDGLCDYKGDSGCSGENDAARDPHVLFGKVLRITRTGGIPSGNPYQGTNSARCNLTGMTTAGKYCQETYASGLRNPFRMAFDPNANGTRFFINDVGQKAWEEIDLGKAGADYGWNLREGPCKIGSTGNCGTVSGITNPTFSYQHGATGTFAECASITGGAFVPNGLWPGLDGAYLFSDYVCGKIFKLVKTSSGYSASVFASGLGNSSAVHLAFGPYNGSKALYYTSYANGGEVRRIAFTGSSNQAPKAVVSASPTYGSLPLTVGFSASASRDPEGGALTYRWVFGDGGTATGMTTSHTYRAKGTYTATLTVRDPQGAQATATVRISAGNTPPTPTITSPSSTARFGVGETITLRGQASDSEDRTLSGSRLSWRVLLHHNAHTHPYLSSTAGQEVRISMPPPEDLAATKTSYLEVFLTATDSGGLSRTVSQKVYPKLMEVTFKTDPTGLSLKVNGETFTAPKILTSWKGYKLNVSAFTQTTSAGKTATFRSWSDGGSASHTITTPASASSYIATYNVK